MSSKSGDMDECSSYACKERTEMVHRVLDGLRDDAFEPARDIGVESLTAPGGIGIPVIGRLVRRRASSALSAAVPDGASFGRDLTRTASSYNFRRMSVLSSQSWNDAGSPLKMYDPLRVSSGVRGSGSGLIP